jgi:hypothetical protein
MTNQDIFGLIAVGISTASCVNYIVSILRGRTKPHAFTWVIWGLIQAIVFVAQWRQGAGAGAWTTGSSTLFCFSIFVLSLFKGEKSITRSDWVAFLCGLAIIPFWRLTHNALLAVLLAIVIDAFAYYPTVRKSWIRPHQENIFMYASDDVRWVFAFLAMSDTSAITLVYPIFCMIANTSLSLMIFVRRLQKARSSASS